MARIKVTVSYVNKNECNLLKDDGEVYMTLHAGDSFCIDNQMREWNVVRLAKKSGKGTILVCEKYRDNGDVLESFALPNHKVGLWATTSGSARNGVFHCYNPSDGVEDIIDSTRCADMDVVSHRSDMKWEDGIFIHFLLTDGIVTPVPMAQYYTVEDATYIFNFDYDPETGRFEVKMLWYTESGLRRAMECLLWVDRYNDPERHEKIMANHPEWDEYDHWAPDDPLIDFNSQSVKTSEKVRTDGVLVDNVNGLSVRGGTRTKIWDSKDAYGEEPFVGRFLPSTTTDRGECESVATTKSGQTITVTVEDPYPDVGERVRNGRLNSYREIRVYVCGELIQYFRTREGAHLGDRSILCSTVAYEWSECPGDIHPFSVDVYEATHGRYGKYIMVYGDASTRQFVENRWSSEENWI